MSRMVTTANDKLDWWICGEARALQADIVALGLAAGARVFPDLDAASGQPGTVPALIWLGPKEPASNVAECARRWPLAVLTGSVPRSRPELLRQRFLSGFADLLITPATGEDLHAFLSGPISMMRRRPAGIVARSPAMQAAVAQVESALSLRQSLVLSGEVGSGRHYLARALLGQSSDSGPIKELKASALRGRPFGKVIAAIDDRTPASVLDQLAETLTTPRLVQDLTLMVVAPDDLGVLGESIARALVPFTVHLPALRHRAEDIEALAAGASRLETVPQPEPGCLAELQRLAWPGNAAQLCTLAERAGRASSNIRRFWPILVELAGAVNQGVEDEIVIGMPASWSSIQARVFGKLIQDLGVSGAAQTLQVGRSTLYKWLEKSRKVSSDSGGGYGDPHANPAERRHV